MKLVLEIRSHDDDTRYFPVTTFPARIGRALNNDVILDDPYVSPHHLRIDCDSGVCTVADKGSKNGFSINGQETSNGDARLKSGDTLRVGETEITVYTPEHPVADTLPLRKDHPIFSWVARPMNVLACFLLSIIVTLGWSWLEIWSDEEKLTLVAATVATAGIIILWSALWSVGGRLTRHRAHFKSHVALICLYILAGTVAWYIEAYADFLTNGNWLSQVITYGLNFILLGFLLYASLTLASKMLPKRRTTVAMLISLSVTISVFIFSIVSTKSFNQRPSYSSTLEPYLSNLAPTQTVNGFMQGNSALFANKTFAHTVKHNEDMRTKAPTIPFLHPKHK